MRRKTHEEFCKEVFDLVGNEYEVLGIYKKSHEKIKIKHNKCGHEYEVEPSNFLNGQRCSKCGKKMKKNSKIFKEEVFDLVGNEYVVLSDYKNNHTKVSIKHCECNHIYDVTPQNFLRGRRCPKCSGLMKKTTKQFENEVFNLVGNEYKVIGEYKNNTTKILMKHIECGYEYEVTPKNFLDGNRCPHCNESKGEKKTREILNKLNIPYQSQFNICRSPKTNKFLPYDFAIIESNKPIAFIEFDGIEHFEPVDYFGGVERFKGVKYRDSIKDTFAAVKNIPLLRIPYFQMDNMESIIKDFINQLYNQELKKAS